MNVRGICTIDLSISRPYQVESLGQGSPTGERGPSESCVVGLRRTRRRNIVSPKSMQMKPICHVFIATSLDGFIARKDGGIDWLEQGPAGEDFGYKMLFNSVDALIMGKNSFEKVLSFPAWPYGKKTLIVLSKSLDALPPSTPTTVRLLQDEPASLLERLVAEGMQSFYVDGGAVIQSFLRANLIDEMTITTVPKLIGDGIPLFGSLDNDISLQLLTSQSFPNGFVVSKYRIVK